MQYKDFDKYNHVKTSIAASQCTKNCTKKIKEISRATKKVGEDEHFPCTCGIIHILAHGKCND